MVENFNVFAKSVSGRSRFAFSFVRFILNDDICVMFVFGVIIVDEGFDEIF